MRVLLIALLLVAGCARTPADPLHGRPVAAWRTVPGVPVHRVRLANGHALLVPDVGAMLCSDATTSNDRALCGIWLDGRTGRPGTGSWSTDPDGVDATFYFTPEDPLLFRRDTRTDPGLLAGHGGDLPEEPVLDGVRGVVAGRRMATGCWRERFEEPHAPTYCHLWIEVPRKGLIEADYYVAAPPRPFRLDRERLRRMVHMLVATERSFRRV